MTAGILRTQIPLKYVPYLLILYNHVQDNFKAHKAISILTAGASLLKQASNMILNAKRASVTVYACQEILSSPYGSKLIQCLLDKWNIAVVTNLMGMDAFDEEDPKSSQMYLLLWSLWIQWV
ncbi:uncharacterized protein MELLADRAFT_65366 [Melampsora larici-populina 98AG31]|uniref:Uncharacterized protein n=1 Tax=Melampsora larici-populina (strain 98AG31 / pathotype 3-4-7) TaxID=747676 RepID=F4RV23_MELLP|nr:uncharacterized protein MELLADRAFT_65366 [Melampsora larici-populina 98AG31]EGG03829.1 hypothetical protein MELLADRAFT_65366 [Melampsora larici-populina 98AG31]